MFNYFIVNVLIFTVQLPIDGILCFITAFGQPMVQPVPQKNIIGSGWRTCPHPALKSPAKPSKTCARKKIEKKGILSSKIVASFYSFNLVKMNHNRRNFIKQVAGYTALSTLPAIFYACDGKSPSEGGEKTDSTATTASSSADATPKPLFFTISLAEWSLHKMLFDKKLDNLQFPVKAKQDFGIDAVEYVNAFFKDKAKDSKYLAELKKICDDNGVTSVLIMVDGEGGLGDTNAKERAKAVENHYQWVEAAKFLGCHSIRVNAYGQGTSDEVAKAAIDGLGKLTEFGMKENIGVIVENHGGYSSDGKWLAQVIGTVNKNLNTKMCGTLPDFGNFCLKLKNDDWKQGCESEYDRYVGTAELMPFAKGVSAKSNDFDEKGNEATKDYLKLLQIVKDAGYTGRIGIEYEGEKLSEEDGIRATKQLLERAGAMVA